MPYNCCERKSDIQVKVSLFIDLGQKMLTEVVFASCLYPNTACREVERNCTLCIGMITTWTLCYVISDSVMLESDAFRWCKQLLLLLEKWCFQAATMFKAGNQMSRKIDQCGSM